MLQCFKQLEDWKLPHEEWQLTESLIFL